MDDEYYATALGRFIDVFKDGAGAQWKTPNNVDKGCQAVFEVVTGTGRGKGKEEHLRLLLSKEVAQRALDQNEKIRKGHEAFRHIWENTGHDGGVAKSVDDLKKEEKLKEERSKSGLTTK